MSSLSNVALKMVYNVPRFSSDMFLQLNFTHMLRKKTLVLLEVVAPGFLPSKEAIIQYLRARET